MALKLAVTATERCYPAIFNVYLIANISDHGRQYVFYEQCACSHIGEDEYDFRTGEPEVER